MENLRFRVKMEIVKILERLLGRQIARRTPERGTNLFANIDQVYGKSNFRVVFDVGANVGQTASVYRVEFPNAEIYSFEPVKRTFNELRANMGTTEGMHLYQIGFGSQASSMTISLGEDSQLSSILHYQGPTSETVEIQTLDEFVARHGLEIIDFLKVDTEGYELEVLKGAHDILRSQRVGMIYIEAELMQSTRCFVSLEKLNAVLTGYGYEIFGVYEQQSHWTGEHSMLFCNILYIAPKLISPNVAPSSYPLRTNQAQ